MVIRDIVDPRTHARVKEFSIDDGYYKLFVYKNEVIRAVVGNSMDDEGIYNKGDTGFYPTCRQIIRTFYLRNGSFAIKRLCSVLNDGPMKDLAAELL